jgi:CubicO group peptidase (beta-lactamase class C family)
MRNSGGIGRELRGQVDRLVAAAVAAGQAPGVVAGLARGADRHVAVAGTMALDGPPMRRDTLFRISSMTKPMTAAAILAQAGAGLLELSEPVDRLLPELAGRPVLRAPDAPLADTVPAARPVTVRDLLTFTGGFGMQGAMFLAPEPWPVVTAAEQRQLCTFGPPMPAVMPGPDTWMARLGELPLLAQPGERWLYQTGSQILGVLAARAAGRPFAEVLRTWVLEPLGMADTAFWAAGGARLATAYDLRGGQWELFDPPDGQWSRPPAFPDGSGGLVSSVDDVLSFGRMLLDGGAGVLAAGAAAEMTRDQLTAAQRDAVWPGFSFLDGRGWGFGLSVLADGSYGWDGGLGTTWSNVPAQDLCVTVLTQRFTGEAGPAAVGADVLAAARAAAG